MAGTGKFLKDMDANMIVAMSDPEGSGLYNKVYLLYVCIHTNLPNLRSNLVLCMITENEKGRNVGTKWTR